MPHCVSSRYVLSHYSKCKDHVCPVCGPVREAIRRNFERSKEVVKLSSTNTARPNDANNPNPGFIYPPMASDVEYPPGFGSGMNGFGVQGGGPAPQLEAPPANVPAAALQKMLNKKTKKEKPEKSDKKDTEGPPTKKIRSSTSSKATAAVPMTAGAPNSNQIPQQEIPQNLQNNENLKNFAPYPQNLPQNQQLPPQGPIHMPMPVAPKSIFPLDPVSCALYNFSPDNVNAHFKHIHEGMKITTCRYVTQT